MSSVNGSSETRSCSNISPILGRELSQCDTPAASVLFDGNIPMLTGLDGSMWASQLLTSQAEFLTEISFEFTGTPGFTGVERVEVVMFNCPQWRIGVNSIRVLGVSTPDRTGRTTNLASFSTTGITSCDSLVRLCIPLVENTLPVIFLMMSIPFGADNFVHLAEITFYEDASASNCTTGPINTAASTDSVITTSPTPITTSSPAATTQGPVTAIAGMNITSPNSTTTILSSTTTGDYLAFKSIIMCKKILG